MVDPGRRSRLAPPCQAAAPHHAAPVAALAAGMRRIEPPLDPKSNRKFWKHDFPHDHQPEADFRGSRPAGMYPVFQNDDVYDRDPSARRGARRHQAPVQGVTSEGVASEGAAAREWP